MSIQRINFTASLLNEVNKPPQVSAENAVPEQSKQEESSTVTNSQEDTTAVKPDHTVRNWSIGLGAAAVLIGLGVAGRKGKLGEGMQKLLGGKPELKPTTPEPHTEIPAGTNPTPKGGGETPPPTESTEGIHTFKDGWDDSELVTEKVGNKSPVTESTPKTETSVPKAEENISSVGAEIKITKAEMEAINSQLDRTIPKIDESLLKIEVSPLDKVIADGLDYTKFEPIGTPNSFKTIEMPGGKKIVAYYGSDGKIYDATLYKNVDNVEHEISQMYFTKNGNPEYYTPKDTNITTFYNEDGTIRFSTPKFFDKKLNFFNNEKGELTSLIQKDENDDVIKDIDFIPGTTKPKQIVYGANSYVAHKAKKIELFKDGVLDKEIFFKDGEKIEVDV